MPRYQDRGPELKARNRSKHRQQYFPIHRCRTMAVSGPQLRTQLLEMESTRCSVVDPVDEPFKHYGLRRLPILGRIQV